MEKKHYYNIEAKRFNALTMRIFMQVTADLKDEMPDNRVPEEKWKDTRAWSFKLQDEVLNRMIDPLYIANELLQMDIEKENEN